MALEIIKTHTGKIYVDRDRELEFLTVGDYGKKNNIKADFLGLHKEIHGVKHRKVDLTKKWVATISTQKGCMMDCKFCDCPKYGFRGNASLGDLGYQIETILRNEAVDHTDRYTALFLCDIVNSRISAKTIHPVVSTMLPRGNQELERFLQEWCALKNHAYYGEAGLQFSINSTDDAQREAQFGGKSLNLAAISALADRLPRPRGRKYTLNFAVTAETILDAGTLSRLFDKQKFIVKITPIHRTDAAIKNGFNVTTEYTDYDVYRKFEAPLVADGWDVIVFVPSMEEDSDRITCGNALIATTLEGEKSINTERTVQG